jgi:hypothetical protein
MNEPKNGMKEIVYGTINTSMPIDVIWINLYIKWCGPMKHYKTLGNSKELK